jgi:hypothetical protein
MTTKPYLLPPLLALLAGCNTSASNGPSLDMMAESAAPVALARAAPPRAADVGSALAHLPEGAGAVEAVRERYYPNGYSQDIALASDAPGAMSHIAIAIQNGRALASNEKVPVWKPGEAGVKQELAREFPNLPMRVVVNGGYENRYGRFGVAIGRAGDALRCIYAWQYIDDARRSFGHGARIPLAGASAAPAAVRIKLCRADATVDALVADVKALSVDIPEDFAASPPVALRVAPARAPRLRAQIRRPAHRAPRPDGQPAAAETFAAPAPADLPAVRASTPTCPRRPIAAPARAAAANPRRPIPIGGEARSGRRPKARRESRRSPPARIESVPSG